MGWLSLILLIVELLTKLPAIIETVKKIIDLIRGQPFWKQAGMRKEAAEAIKAALARTEGRDTAVLQAFAQRDCAFELKDLCQKWEAKYGKAK